MKNVYISWHYTNHGVAYLKHILSKFYLIEKLPDNIDFNYLEQENLNSTFNVPIENGFTFDEIIYLIAPQNSFDGLSSRRFSHRNTALEDSLIAKSNLKILYEELITLSSEHRLHDEITYIEKNHPELLADYKEMVWRNIQHYPVEEQIKWLTEYSNFKNVYDGKIHFIELDVNDLRDEKQISNEVSKWAKKYFSKQVNTQAIINVSLGSSETQVIWHILAEVNQLPDNTRFIKTYDDKTDSPEKRFKRFAIKEVSTKLISNIGSEFKLFKETKSPSRDLVNKKMKTLLQTGFSILLLGERGIGKSKIADDARNSIKDNKFHFVEANCASFDEDSKAEAELFGYEKGAFTGANTEKDGLLIEANGGVLFLDEIHHLSKPVQAKLMKALQTRENNKMFIRRMGSTKETMVECRLIFATNKSIKELRECLLPDFYDRIVQHVVHIPSLRETVEDRIDDWKNIWQQLKFKNKIEAPNEKELISWLKNLPLYGNYRDLQKIAIYYNAFIQFDEETKNMLDEKTPFEYAKNEFEKYHSPIVQLENEKYNFNIKQTAKEMQADYLFALQDWAVNKFQGRNKAIEHFHSLGEQITDRTLNNWKNRKMIK